MKALFYTATAVFIAFAGVFAWFALQAPLSTDGARIVLDIDVSGMPAEAEDNRKAAYEPYAGEEDKPAAEQDQPAEASGPAETERSEAEAQQQQQLPQQSPTAALHETPTGAGAAPEEIPAPPPGTALAGLNQDRPLFREVEPERQPVEAEADLSSSASQLHAEAPAERATEPGLGLPGTALSGPNGLRGSADLTPGEAAPAPAQRSFTPEPEQHAAAPATPAAEPAQPAAALPPPPPVPVRRPNNIPPQEVAAAGGSWAGVQFATTEVNTKPARVAILLRNVGRHDQDSADAIGSLPSAISLGFWPYASEGKRLASRARERGHEIIVQVPLEPSDFPNTNPGPDALLTSLTPEQNSQRLETLLKRFEGSSGVTNLMGGKMLQSKASLKPVLEDIKARGLLYIGESNNSHTTARQLAREISLRFGTAEVMIDANPSPEAIDKALTRLVTIARQRGSAIGIGTASAITVQQVHEWSASLAAQGITLVPVGALAQAPGASQACSR
jgi:hypothetical protein